MGLFRCAKCGNPITQLECSCGMVYPPHVANYLRVTEEKRVQANPPDPMMQRPEIYHADQYELPLRLDGA